MDDRHHFQPRRGVSKNLGHLGSPLVVVNVIKTIIDPGFEHILTYYMDDCVFINHIDNDT